MTAPENIRCAFCDRLLDTAAALTAGECGCRFQHRDVLLNPETGRLFLAEWDKYRNACDYTELAPMGRFSQPNPPQGAVLLCRTVDGKRLPVTDIGDGELYTVRTVGDGQDAA